MKKTLLSLLFLGAFVTVIAQNVPRQMVVVEVGTGTWCTYCPGAAMGVDDLLEEGKFVAVVENHNGDSYANNFSNARNNLYAISGFPTATFDGTYGYVGGNHSTSLYPTYLPKYNQAIAVTSPVEMSMTETHTGLDYTVNVTINKVGTISASTVKLFFAVTQSHITQSWQGQNHLEHVNRKMVPDQNGTVLDFTSGNTQTVTLNFSMLATWPLEDCEFVAWVQNMDAGQGTITGSVKKWVTLQGIKRGVIDLTPGFSVPSTSVTTNSPVTFTNTTSGGYIGVPESYEWIFEGGTPATSTEENPVVTYATCGTFDVTLIVNRGGQTDTLIMPDYIAAGPVVAVTATPDTIACWYTTITLDATTQGAVSYLWTPGGATTPTLDVTWAGYGMGQHNFEVLVDFGPCQITKAISATLDECTGMGEKTDGLSVSVYPNPGHGVFTLDIAAPDGTVADLTVTSGLGTTVYSERNITLGGKTLKSADLSHLRTGIYFMTLKNSEMSVVRKIVVD